MHSPHTSGVWTAGSVPVLDLCAGDCSITIAQLSLNDDALMSLTGAEHVYDLGDLSDYEKAGLELLKPELKASIDKVRLFLQLCWLCRSAHNENYSSLNVLLF